MPLRITRRGLQAALVASLAVGLAPLLAIEAAYRIALPRSAIPTEVSWPSADRVLVAAVWLQEERAWPPRVEPLSAGTIAGEAARMWLVDRSWEEASAGRRMAERIAQGHTRKLLHRVALSIFLTRHRSAEWLSAARAAQVEHALAHPFGRLRSEARRLSASDVDTAILLAVWAAHGGSPRSWCAEERMRSAANRLLVRMAEAGAVTEEQRKLSRVNELVSALAPKLCET